MHSAIHVLLSLNFGVIGKFPHNDYTRSSWMGVPHLNASSEEHPEVPPAGDLAQGRAG